MDKAQFVCNIVEKINRHDNYTQEEINTAFSYFRELTMAGQSFGSKADTMQIGGLLSAALSEISK